ncbi:C-5 cytosine-specific DNA methylase [Phlyctema vagabunda]|uniref:DNA (cytosine-5-)-methyltransferase n=1 Tax=Phlyctema vagabunda TaxID=108571 RepID=A0ABR4PG45_9HELO
MSRKRPINLDDDGPDLVILKESPSKRSAHSGHSPRTLSTTSSTATTNISNATSEIIRKIPIRSASYHTLETVIDLTDKMSSDSPPEVERMTKDQTPFHSPTVVLDDIMILQDKFEKVEPKQQDIAERSNSRQEMGGFEYDFDVDFFEIEDPEFRQQVPELRDLPVWRVEDVYNAEEQVHAFSAGRRAPKDIKLRNPDIQYPLTDCDKVSYNGLELRPQKVVELSAGDFLRIEHIIRNEYTGQITLRGMQMLRANRCHGILENKLNEVCSFMELDDDDRRGSLQQGAVEVSIREVVGIRILQLTNQPFPIHTRYHEHENEQEALQIGRLILRWQYVCKYKSAADRDNNKWSQRILSRLDEEKIAKNLRATATDLRRCWLNKSTSLADSETKNSAGVRDLLQYLKHEHRLPNDLDVVECTGVRNLSITASKERVLRKAGQKLTYGDGFCGAGGSTQGAKMAGLDVRWGFDFSKDPCATWQHNFPGATCYPMHSQEFCSLPVDEKKCLVDILHLSPPCQYFSPAHTRDGKDDEMNTASLYACGAVIEQVRPRIVTLEQTFGICYKRFEYYLNSLIHQFVALGFSVRWAIVYFPTWGLPSRRNRLIVIAACPGEVLPDMPPAIRSLNGENGLKRFATVNEALEKVRTHLRYNRKDPSVDKETKYPNPKPQYDGNESLRRAMTTNGGGNYHPDGTRDFTLREYAVLQGFPANYKFKGKSIKKQIGNAVPPVVAKHLYRHIIKTLDAADKVTPEASDRIEL